MIEVKGICKSFGGRNGSGAAGSGAGPNLVLRYVDLEIADGEFFCLLGPSGCGKTTLLRVVAGLEKPDAGRVKVGGKDVTDAPPHKRGCALVFQNYALWPHLTVRENIVYGLEVQRLPKGEIQTVLEESLRVYQLEGLESRFPHQLSGGQQQRVALARAMAINPHAVLMDEPLSNLDAALRKTLRRELLDFHRKAGSTILYVTHDQEEAMALSDRIAVMMEGRIVETGAPSELYARPRRLETAQFLGDMNVMRNGSIPESIRSARNRSISEPIPSEVGETGAIGRGQEGASGPVLCIRPENVRVHAADRKSARNGILQGTLAFIEFMGTHATLGVDTPSGRILARVDLSRVAEYRPGQAVDLEFPAEHRLWY
ncbi:MAG: ABC transporter ATP-binding protein [Fibrobacterota bacterium]|nr:ABC transporter ATP-binding protein [Fibrobacterota bacterium]